MTSPFVVDNSVVMAWCFEDEDSAYADNVLGHLANAEAIVPGIWPLEVANVLLVAERKSRLARGDGVRFLNLLRALPIRVEHEPLARVLGEVLALARETGLSSYDAAYLDLAMRQAAPIATLDVAMRKAARHCRVPILDLS